MKKVATYLILLCVLCSCSAASAQSFSVVHDTMYITTSSSSTSIDSVFNTTLSGISIDWRIISTDFPADWQAHTGICDVSACYQMNIIGTTDTQSVNYPVGYDLINCSTDLSSCAPGCYYVTARLENSAIPTDTAYITWMVCKPYPSGVNIDKGRARISIYPQPAISNVAIVCDGMADVQTIEIYSMAGRKMRTIAGGGAETDLNISDIPGGLYLVKLLDMYGNIVATEKLIKQ